MGLGDFDVFEREPPAGATLIRGEGANDLRGATEHHGIRRTGKTLGHERTRADDAAGADHGLVQHDGAHADEATILDHAGVQNGGVADRAIRADAHTGAVGEVNDDVILNVAAGADHDALDIATQHGAVEHARITAKRHIADDSRAFGDKHCARRDGRL